ncbi:WG repeat-containing protein [Fulvivirga lutea]|uniref:WG repeat-containing protein n=1 Tax=Fulvivirga lutea TaxID=2810512 RepID=A0A974WJ75_9BACT|nr:WG repeat-containing protein [Fulvivirga lutea]QSE99180.1 WG repeat-containing protein [Fulvivirga lutea]
MNKIHYLILILISTSSLSFGQSQETFVPFRVNDLWGYSDIQGNILIEPQYSEAHFFYDDLATVKHKYGKQYVIDRNNEVIFKTPDSLKIVDNFYEGIAIYESNKTYKKGYIKKTGELITPAIYYQAEKFIDGKAIVKLKYDQVGIINSEGTYKIEPIYQTLWQSNNVYVVRFNEKYGLLNEEGNVVLPITHEHYDYNLSEDFRIYTFGNNGKYKVYDQEGKQLLSELVTELYVINEKRKIIVAKIDDKYQLINLNSGQKREIQADQIFVDQYSRNLNEIYFTAKLQKEFLIYNLDGQITGRLNNIKRIDHMSEGMARVDMGDVNNYVNHKGTFISEKMYQRNPGDFVNGFASVSRNNLFGFINKEGKEVIPCQFSRVSDFNKDGHSIVETINPIDNTTYHGIVNTKGDIVLPLEYRGDIYDPNHYLGEIISDFPKDFYFIQRYGYVGKNGFKYFKSDNQEKVITEESVVESIRAKFYPTNANISKFKEYSTTIDDTLFVGHYENDVIRKITVKSPNNTSEYYYHEDLNSFHPYFIYKVEGKKEHRFYYYNRNLIRYINPEGENEERESFDSIEKGLMPGINNSLATIQEKYLTESYPSLFEAKKKFDRISDSYLQNIENWKKIEDNCEECEGTGETAKDIYYVNNGDTLLIKHEYWTDHHYSKIYKFYSKGELFLEHSYSSSWGFTGYTPEGRSTSSDHYDESKTYFIDNKRLVGERSITDQELSKFKFKWKIW